MAKRTYNRRGRTTAKKPVTSDKRRAQRVKGSETARATGSKDRVTRGRGVTRNRTGAPRGAQGPRTAPQQGPNRPSPRNLTISGDTGRRGGVNKYGTERTPIPKSTVPTPGTRLGKVKAGKMASNVVNAAARRIVGDGSAAAFQMAQMAAEALRQQKTAQTKTKSNPTSSVGKYNTKDKDGTVRSRAKVGPKKVGTVAESFDKAFTAARKAGKKTFTFKGKKYTTKMKGE